MVLADLIRKALGAGPLGATDCVAEDASEEDDEQPDAVGLVDHRDVSRIASLADLSERS